MENVSKNQSKCKNILGFFSNGQSGTFWWKNRRLKIPWYCPFKCNPS
jgi:hypothetical protein